MTARKTFAITLCAAALAVTLSGPGAARAAEIEKELVVRTEADKTTISGLVALFEKKYPGTKVIWTTMGSSESLVKSFREMPNPQADILTTKAFLMIKGIGDSMKQHGQAMFEPYKSKERARLDPRLIDKDGHWQTERWAARVIIYHEDAAKKYGDIKCLKDLLTWKGSFEYADPIKTGAGFSAVLTMIQNFGGWEKPEGGIDFAAKLAKARKMNNPETSTMIQMFTRKEIDAHWNFDIYFYRLMLQRKIPVRAVYPCEGTIFDANAVAILRNAKNPKAARAWVDLVLSKEAQAWIVANTFYRTAAKVEALPPEMKKIMIPGEERIRFDVPWNTIAERTTQYKQLWESRVAR